MLPLHAFFDLNETIVLLIYGQASAFRHLSPREIVVLLLVSEGKRNQEIADELSISERTVGNHVSGFLDKLGLANRIELATYAVKHHIGTYPVPDAGKWH